MPKFFQKVLIMTTRGGNMTPAETRIFIDISTSNSDRTFAPGSQRNVALIAASKRRKESAAGESLCPLLTNDDLQAGSDDDEVSEKRHFFAATRDRAGE